MTDVSELGLAIIPDVDFSDVTDIQIEAAYSPGNAQCYHRNRLQQRFAKYCQRAYCSDFRLKRLHRHPIPAVYNGATGGYNGVANMYITVSANAEFSVENYKTALDKADYIIAYSRMRQKRIPADFPTTELL